MADSSRCTRCGGETEVGVCPRCVFELAVDNAETAADGAAEPTPDQIGPYKILELLGRGGMGVVYLAEQHEPVRRRVAIKLIKLGMDTREIVSRFETERQALALMNHPCVARVLDAGATEAGRPYFVMEFIQGEPIHRYCDNQRLNTRQRLELFARVCQGVQHAHQKGVIHRDIKPSNVLVETIDDRPVPKIIDFGVAKATQQQSTERTLFTRHGQLIGTPEYMSPEQADAAALDVDSRTDVYSLGVLLYELLAGTVPFDSTDLRRAAFDEICRRIREDEPSRPSTRVETLGDAADEVARTRQSDPSSLSRQLRGDLDWITMKALEKDRTRRYGSPEALADDIARFLNDEPVTAGPPSGAYRFKKFVKRHTIGVVAASVVVLALLVAVVGTSYGMTRARRAEAQARSDAATATEVVDFLTGLFKVSDPEVARGDTVTVREVLDRGRRDIEYSVVEPQTRSHLMKAIGEVYLNLGVYEPAEELLLESVRTRTELLGATAPATLDSKSALAEVHRFTGDLAGAEQMHREVLETRQQVLGPEHLATAQSMNDLGVILMMLGRHDDGEQLFQSALAITRQRFEEEPRAALAPLANLGWVHIGKGRYAEAEAVHRESLTVCEDRLGPLHPQTLTSKHNLGYAVWRQSRFDEAEQIYREVLEERGRVLGESHPATLDTLNMLANVYLMQGRYEEADDRFNQVLEQSRAKLGEDHAGTLRALNNLGMTAQRAGRLDQAAESYAEVLERRTRVLGDEHPETLSATHNLAVVLTDLGKYPEAERLHRQNLERRRRVLGEEHPTTLWSSQGLAELLPSLGRLAEAVVLHEQLLATRRRILGDDHYDTIISIGQTARAYAQVGRSREAESLFAEGLERSTRVLGQDHPETVALESDYDETRP